MTVEENAMAVGVEEAPLDGGGAGAAAYDETLESPIPRDVLEALLPGDDVVEVEEPEVGGCLGYRFAKRAFDLASCSAALVVLAIPMAVIAARIRMESPGPAIYAQRRVGLGAGSFPSTSSAPCTRTPRPGAPSGPPTAIRA